MVIVGRIVTMAEPPIAEALFIEDGTVAAVGTRDEVLALAGDQVPVFDLGEDVAYPGFIDAHAHWIGDREYYAIESPAAAMDAAVSRGWTSISEQWVNQERIDELTALAAAGDLPLRVDAYLALNFGTEFFGDWYASREPGPVGDTLRVRGVKIHVDNGEGSVVNWTAGRPDRRLSARRTARAGRSRPTRSAPRPWRCSSTPSRPRSARPVPTRCTTGSSTRSRCRTTSWPAWWRWTSPR